MSEEGNVRENNFPVIDLGDYILREQTLDDLEDFHNYYTDPIVNEFIVSDIPNSLEESKYELQYWINVYYNRSGIYFGIARKDNNQLVGSVGITGINRTHNRCEISYDLAKEYWNQGVMTKALNALTKYTFEELKINRIEAYALKENVASRALLKKCHFYLEGELVQHRKHRGVYTDIGIFSFVRGEYDELMKGSEVML